MSSEPFFVKENAIGAQADFHALLEIYVADASDETQRSVIPHTLKYHFINSL